MQVAIASEETSQTTSQSSPGHCHTRAREERERERSPRVGPSAAGVHDMLTRRNVGPNAYPAVAAQVHNQQFVDESGG
jgi:hypothetical protein